MKLGREIVRVTLTSEDVALIERMAMDIYNEYRAPKRNIAITVSVYNPRTKSYTKTVTIKEVLSND